MADYARVLESCLFNCGLPAIEEGLSRTLWNSFRNYLNQKTYEYWTRASLPFNTVTATLNVTVDVLPFPQQDVSDHPSILRVLEVRDTSGNLKSYQDAGDHLLFGPGGDASLPFKVVVTYIKTAPNFPDTLWSSGLSVSPGDIVYWTGDNNFYEAHTSSTAGEFNPGPGGPFNKMKIPDSLVNCLAFGAASLYHIRNEDKQMAILFDAKAEQEWSRVIQQYTSNVLQNRKTYRINYR